MKEKSSLTWSFSIFPIFSQSLMASSMEPGLLGEGGSAMPVRALPPALERLAEVAEAAPPTLPPGGPDTATVVMEERISLDSDSQQMFYDNY